MHTAFAVIRRMVIVLAAGLALLVTTGFASEVEDRARLDALFADLKAAASPETAQAISQQIWAIWTTPSDPQIAERMLRLMAARSVGDLPEALLLLDRLIADYPAYAEGWNQRATLRYLVNDFDGSLADIEKVLQFEPRHFGALSGRVLIYLAQGRRAEALRDMATALTIHPFLNERQLFPELQEDMVRI